MSTRHTVLKRKFHWLVISVLIALSCGWIDAQDMTFFALRRPGQGSVAIDHKTFTAYITDLGNAGDGDLATLDGKPLLDRLAELQMKRLVFTCSHPHSDHMGGIRALFEKPSGFFLDERLTVPRFDSISVIDDEAPKGTSLFDILKGSVGTNTALRIHHLSAKDTNAFAEISHQGDSVFIENVPYGARKGASAHGRSIVTRVVLGGTYSTVDFDDADSSVIKLTTKVLGDNKTSIDSFVVPHHGSALHDIDPILALGPTVAIISVNVKNPYGHPSPAIVLRLMSQLKPENIIFTGSAIPLTIGPSGIQQSSLTAANPAVYELLLKPGYERAKSRKDYAQMAQYEELRAKIEGNNASTAQSDSSSKSSGIEIARAAISTKLEIAEQNVDDILSIADRLALSTQPKRDDQRRLDEIKSQQRRDLDALMVAITTFESQYHSQMEDERKRLSLLFIKNPRDDDGSAGSRSDQPPPSGPQSGPGAGPLSLAIDEELKSVPKPLFTSRSVDRVQFVADLKSVQSSSPAIQTWHAEVAEDVPRQLDVPFSTVLNPKSTAQRPGGISIGNVASSGSTVDLRDYLLVYDPGRRKISLKGPEGREISYVPTIDPISLKALYRYAASERNAAVSMSLSKGSQLYRIIRLDPAFVDTPVGRDLIATDLIGWGLDKATLPNGSSNPFSFEFSKEEHRAFACIDDALPFSDLIDQPTDIEVLQDSLQLKGGMGFQYMVDVPKSTECSVMKCSLPDGETKACHFTNLESYAHGHYAQMLQVYQPLERVDQDAKLVSFLRWGSQIRTCSWN